ncbi:hypothetical protein HYC85_024807 [Camellia sinensis]|uniref:NAB domain-containing protein n=1 Tax=Camellia sinensis TaxID=4442 RepID=A0A7J7GBJ6_CAMSI|nr:hypothetical protein HYC85_024807 [Camellia sinensis]
MVEAKTKALSHWWWFDCHNKVNDATPRRSPWLQSTLAELDEKTKAMLRIIEEDAESFAQRAEMYYTKRPELIGMVEDLYRANRSLAERYDQVKSDTLFRLISPWESPLSLKNRQKSIASVDKSYDSYSESYDPMESGESEVDDPEHEEEEETDEEEEEVSSEAVSDEVMKLREEIEKLKEENKIQKEQLVEKDEEKREVIRQLSVAMDLLKEENVKLRKFCIAKESPKKWSPAEFHKLKDKPRGGATEEGGGEDPNGEMAMLGPGASVTAVSSGFGGLRFEGMVGSEDSDGEGTPGEEGKRGVMSGDKVGGEEEERGGFGRVDGEAEMGEDGSKASDEENEQTIMRTTMTNTDCRVIEAIIK